MKRVSSATGYNERHLNNTRVFRSQDGIPVLLRLVAVGFSIAGLVGCRRSATGKGGESAAAEARRAAETLPQRTLPSLPPVIPIPEELSAQDTAATHKGGSLRVHLDGDPPHLNPLSDPDASALQILMGLVYEPLLACPSPGVSGDFRPVLADSWEISSDGLRVSLHLRPGVRWHDGHLFTVLDAQASLEPLLRANGSGNAVTRASLQDVASIEIAADRIVRLILKRPSNFVLRALCDVAMLPDHLLRGAGADRQPIGTGPFRFGAWERGKRIRISRSSSYWGTPAALDDIVFEIDPDGARALMRTRRGEIDVLPRVLPVHYPDEVDPVTLHGILSLWRTRPDRWAYVAVNHRRPPFEDARYRHALSALWDRERFARDLHQGLAHPLSAPPFANAPALPSGRNIATAELESAGYRDSNADGVRDVAGKPFRHTLLLTAGARTAATEAHAFVFEARKAGILIDLVSLDAATLLARVRAGDFDLALMMWEGQPDEDPALTFGSAGPFNFWGYRSPEVDALLDTLREASGLGARKDLLASLGTTLAREQPVLFLYQFDVPALVANRVHGLAAFGGRLDLRRVWIDP